MSFYQRSNAWLGYDRATEMVDTPQEWKSYVKKREEIYERLLPGYVDHNMKSEAMWLLRGRYASGEDIGIRVSPGDICWLDYGQTFNNEMGYQHFGLVLSLCNRKAVVVPVTSNEEMYRKAKEKRYPHLMRIGMPAGLRKKSTLFLNDLRYINTARILEKRAHIDTDSELFREICDRIEDNLFSSVRGAHKKS
jgi:hypothetical protein